MILSLSFFAGCVGVFIGSFLDVLANRLPQGEDVFLSRSHCDRCKTPLAWYELIPLLSFVRQKGKCVHCHTTLSWEYPLIEIVTAFIFTYLTWTLFEKNSLIWLGSIVISSSLLVIFIADFKYFIIPDSMIVASCIGVLMAMMGQGGMLIVEHGAVGVAAFSFFLFLWLVTKKRGIGFGDVKLAFFIGFLVGFPQVVSAFYLAFLTGAVCGIILMIVHRKTLKSKLPFGPFLIIGLLGSYVISLSRLLGL
jgi:leader peptidase (prepilin peptidase) / N-methyltransferase